MSLWRIVWPILVNLVKNRLSVKFINKNELVFYVLPRWLSMVERPLGKREAAGSNPARGSMSSYRENFLTSTR